jgi:hypothetical protein
MQRLKKLPHTAPNSPAATVANGDDRIDRSARLSPMGIQC